jgi:4-hydroxybenzoate polyprenyltransferase
MAIMPLIDLVLTGCEWVPTSQGLPPGIWTFLLMSLANGCVAEFGRKIWAPSNERPGVDSYGSAWGIPRANVALAVAWVAAFAALVGYGSQLGMTNWFAGAGTMASLPLLAGIAAFLADSSTLAQKRLEAASGIWILLCYVLAATLPFLRGV